MRVGQSNYHAEKNKKPFKLSGYKDNMKLKAETKAHLKRLRLKA